MGQTFTTPEKAIEIAARSNDKYPSIEYNGESKIKVSNNSTTLSREQLIDKIKGTIYGNCIGDAIGLATEFMTKKEAKEHYGNGPIDYCNFVRDFHRSRWREGDWTDDSDQMILIIDCLLAHGGEVSAIDYAQRILYWSKHGFPEVGDLSACGLGQTTSHVLDHTAFKTDPHCAAKAIWERSNRNAAPNGAVMRTSVLGVVNFNDIEKVVTNTREICLTTHADPRCLASAITVTTAIALILQGQYNGSNINSIIEQATTIAKREIEDIQEFERHANVNKLEDLKLDEQNKIGYTYKALGAGLYCLKNENDFKKAITELALEAGDADTNAAVAGALLGCKIGYSNLPLDWLNGMPAKNWLDARVNKLIDLLQI
eukprot:TRINITY_DN720_c0_g1_i1.p1 TRINITY_DN720_c0_g1~~TRINITY_DN720_c0_g1_i1.p1  ORF type:complete len:372 (-),score=186.10 TRINITY_DN720_c0_g1_i1:740-1855(-)